MKRPDRLMFIVILLLLLAGVIFVFDASVAEAFYQFNNKYYFAKQQLVWAAIGIGAMIFTSLVPISWWKKIGAPLFFFSVLLLIAVLIPGIGTTVQGAKRWIALGNFRFQPSELVKVGVIFYFSSWLLKHQRFWPFMMLTGVLSGLLLLQPDMGTTLVLVAICVSLFIGAGGEWKHIAGFGIVGILSILLLIIFTPWRMKRFVAFQNPESDPLGASYHIRQVTIALGSGGWWGQGIGQSRQKYQYIPEASTDSIFAIAAEEIGFIGSAIIFLLYICVLMQGFTIVERTKDPYARLVGLGIVTWIGAQTLLNLGSIVALVPFTGVPLPYISYGGSSLVSILAASGILIGIGRKTSS